MSSNQSGNQGKGNAQQGHASGTLGVGGPTSGETGSTLTHETQAETGGSGGSGLTRNEVGASRQGAGQDAQERQSAAGGAAKQGAAPAAERESKPSAGDSAMNAHMRGFQDTRSEQAGGSETGLGSPETGANQDIDDIERQAGARKE